MTKTFSIGSVAFQTDIHQNTPITQSTGHTFQHGERKILAFLANFGYYVTNLRTFWCTFTGLYDAVVYQYGQIRGIRELKKLTGLLKLLLSDT